MFLATLAMVASVTLTTLSSSLSLGSVPSLSISCFYIRTWFLAFYKGNMSGPEGPGSHENDRDVQIITAKSPNCLKPFCIKAGPSCVAEVPLRAL